MSLRNIGETGISDESVIFCKNFQENQRRRLRYKRGHITITLLLVTIWIISDSITWAIVPIAIAAWWIGHYLSSMLFGAEDLRDCSTQVSCKSQCPLEYPNWCPNINKHI